MLLNLFGKKKSLCTPIGTEVVGSARYLAQHLCDLLKQEGAVLENGIVCLSKYDDLKIRVEPEQITNQSAVLNFFLSCPKWDRQLFECCASPGTDTKQAIGMALGSFVFGIFSGLRMIYHGEKKCRITTEFNQTAHHWSVYQSDLVAMGDSIKKTPNGQDYWNCIQPHLSEYLGDRKICYIKIYGALVNGEITGECRINDVNIPKLGDEIGKMVAQWEVPQFASQKQFFFLVQDDETCHPYPYTQDQIREKVRMALNIFATYLPQEDGYELCHQQMKKQLPDPHLAAELFAFIPEFCALLAFPKIQHSGKISISLNQKVYEYESTQLSIYHLLAIAMEQMIRSQELSETLYNQLISVSSIWGAICSAKQKGVDITKEGGPIHILYSFPDDYIPR